jgi:ribosomal protein S27AE
LQLDKSLSKSPYDGDIAYWSLRESKLYDGETSKALKRQNHTCAYCGHRFMPGERVHLHLKRGLYRTAQGWLINADAQGAANIGRKVEVMLGLDLSGISRGTLSMPLRVPLWA